MSLEPGCAQLARQCAGLVLRRAGEPLLFRSSAHHRPSLRPMSGISSMPEDTQRPNVRINAARADGQPAEQGRELRRARRAARRRRPRPASASPVASASVSSAAAAASPRLLDEPATPCDGSPESPAWNERARQAVALGEARVGALRAPVRELTGAEQLLLECVAGASRRAAPRRRRAPRAPRRSRRSPRRSRRAAPVRASSAPEDMHASVRAATFGTTMATAPHPLRPAASA